jgi:leucyl aminopeptidase
LTKVEKIADNSGRALFFEEQHVEFSISAGSPEKQRTACVVVGVFESRKLSPSARAMDQASKGYLSEIIGRGDMQGKAATALLLYNVRGTAAERVLLVGLGQEKELREKNYRDAIATAVRTLNEHGIGDAVLCLNELEVPGRNARWRMRQSAMVALDSLYRFDRLKSKKNEEPRRTLARLSFLAEKRGKQSTAEEAMGHGVAIAHGMKLARDLGNLPPNVCTPTYIAEQAHVLAREYKQLDVEVLEREDMEKLGMATLLSVARGSHQPPKLVVLRYTGAKASAKPVTLVGKGITFDTGGISLKPPAEMDEMKFDMCGAAAVLGTVKACCEMRLPLNLVGLIPTTENMPGGGASRPGDIVTSMSGQTVEILNTDAEGRLILCDTLTYAERFEPQCVVDVATLTGACVIALGNVATGLMSNDDELAAELLECGHEAFDRAWQLPLWDDYQEQLKSNFADIPNIGSKGAGTITAACFLSRFAKKFRWAHLDIAGTAWASGKEKGATGRPVPLLAHFLLDRAKML